MDGWRRHEIDLDAAPNGGYLRIAADQGQLQTVIRFQARHRADPRLGAVPGESAAGLVSRADRLVLGRMADSCGGPLGLVPTGAITR
jgi:hypothetical protein